MSHRLRRASWAVAALFASIPVLAQTQASTEPDSEWEAFVPASTGTVAAPVGPTTPEGGFSAPERVIFSEKMRERVLDQLCRQLKLQYDYNLPGDFGGTGAGFRRWLAPLPDGRLTIVDEERLSVGYGHGFSKVLDAASGVTAGIWLGGRLEGSSMVIRPLPGKETCKEVDTLIDLRDIKTVLPFKAERVSAMKVGELWRLPFRLTVGHTESIGDVITQGAAQNFNVSLSFNGTESGAATLTIFRLSESQLRFRFRVDRVEIRTKGGNLVETIPAIDFPSLGANILMKFVNHEIARQLERYTTASLGFSTAKSHGKRVVLEYIVDPRDPVQAEAVAKALHGDFESLVKMGWHMGTQQATDESTQEAYRKMQEVHDAELGPASFAAINAYTQKAKNIGLNIPLIMSHHWSKLTGEETMTRYTDVQGDIHFERADKSRQSEYLSLPWVGPLVKDQVQRDVQVVTAAKSGDPYGDPIVVYLQQHGFLRTTESSIREKAKNFSDIMALAGTRGQGPNPRLRLPIDEILPPPPPPAPAYGRGDFDEPGNQEPSNRKGSLAFTLVFNQAGVKQLIAATADDVVKAYAAVSDSQPAMRWLLANGTVREDGKIDYDWRKARAAFPADSDGRATELSDMETISRQTAGLVADLLAARNAPDNQARSEALMKAFGGLGKSGLGYDEVLRVFVQLVDPMNMTGDFVASVDRPKKEKDVNAHFILKKNRPDNPLLRLAGEAKSRFAEPSILTD